MAEATITELSDRVRTLEREVAEIRSQVATGDKEGADWVKGVAGSMKDFPAESFKEIMAEGRAIVNGEAADPDPS